MNRHRRRAREVVIYDERLRPAKQRYGEDIAAGYGDLDNEHDVKYCMSLLRELLSNAMLDISVCWEETELANLFGPTLICEEENAGCLPRACLLLVCSSPRDAKQFVEQAVKIQASPLFTLPCVLQMDEAIAGMGDDQSFSTLAVVPLSCVKSSPDYLHAVAFWKGKDSRVLADLNARLASRETSYLDHVIWVSEGGYDRYCCRFGADGGCLRPQKGTGTPASHDSCMPDCVNRLASTFMLRDTVHLRMHEDVTEVVANDEFCYFSKISDELAGPMVSLVTKAMMCVTVLEKSPDLAVLETFYTCSPTPEVLSELPSRLQAAAKSSGSKLGEEGKLWKDFADGSEFSKARFEGEFRPRICKVLALCMKRFKDRFKTAIPDLSSMSGLMRHLATILMRELGGCDCKCPVTPQRRHTAIRGTCSGSQPGCQSTPPPLATHPKPTP
eukprot:COSAG01_NODE_11656_length_1886_cov_3.487969_1_plen_442_part_10